MAETQFATDKLFASHEKSFESTKYYGHEVGICVISEIISVSIIHCYWELSDSFTGYKVDMSKPWVVSGESSSLGGIN